MTAPTDRLEARSRLDWIALGLVVLCTAALTTFQVHSLDLWHNLAAGRWIVEHGAIPREEPFTVLGQGRPWIYHEWPFGLVAFGLWTLGGAHLLVAAKSALLCAVAALLYGWSRRRGASPVLALLMVVLGVVGARFRMNLRPHLVVFLVLPLTVMLLEQGLRGDRRALLALLPVQVLWANAHGSFVLGPALAVAAAASGLLGRWLPLDRSAPASNETIRDLGLTAGALAAVSLLNPYGARIYGFAAHVEGMASTQEHITEWMAPAASDWVSVPGLLLAGGVVAGAALGARRRLAWFDVAVLAMLAVLAFRALRFHGELALVGAPLLAGWLGRLVEGAASLKRHARPARLGGLAAALLAVGVELSTDEELVPGWDIEERLYPDDLARFALALETPGDVASPYVWGSYLVWVLDGRRRPLMDGRADVYDQQTLVGLMEGDGEIWTRTLREHEIGLMATFVPPAQGQAQALMADRWALVFWDDLGALWLRRATAAPADLEAYALRAVGTPAELEARPPSTRAACDELLRLVERSRKHATAASWAGRCLVTVQPPDLVGAEVMMREALRLRPTAGSYNDLGIVLQAGGDAAGAEAAYRTASRLDPGHAEAAGNLADLLWSQGRTEEAKAAYRRFLEVAPASWAVERERAAERAGR